VAALALGAHLAASQAMNLGEVKTISATVEAIDYDARLVTLKAPDGQMETIFVPPTVERFAALKVGDTVTFRYHESVVLQLRKPGEPAAPAPPSDPTLVRTPGAKPGGTLSQQITATVTVVAVDPEVPSITVRTEDGRTMSQRVQDKTRLEGVKPGDKIEITYTQALAVSVTGR
jgi:Cu/Ag efflux protein CusF